MKTVCIEGWRGVNHSIAMVNQQQLLALLGHADLQVYHRDLPFFMRHWTPARLPAGFAVADAERIAAVPIPPEGLQPDCLLRMVSPFITTFTPGQKTLTFMVTECALVDACFDRRPSDLAAFTQGQNRIITPSHWSRARLVDHGFDAEHIHVVPHAVRADTFRPLLPAERLAARRQLGVADDETLFLNVGVATWNKGLDLLVTAFAQVKQRLPRARLMFKENKALYGLSVDRTVAELQRARPDLITGDVLAGISVISSAIDQAQLRTLYGCADAYVSPYRAEGFNLPVLEAMACATPVLVTAGGATDDFCPPALSLKIAARPGTRADAPEDVGPFQVPDVDALTEAMAGVAEGRVADEPADAARRQQQRQALLSRLSWPAVADQLAALF